MNERFKNFYMDVALQASKMSRAQRLQVGCVIVKDDNIISFSWNGTPSGWDNECEHKHYNMARDYQGNFFPGSEKEYPFVDNLGQYRLVTKPVVLHAEMNALMKLAKTHGSGDKATLFVTHAPCLECAKGIYQAGINSVYFGNYYRDRSGLEFLKRAGVPAVKHPE